jgi:pilus assembly protein CpaE
VIAIGGGPSFKGKAAAMIAPTGSVTWFADRKGAEAAIVSEHEPALVILVAPDVDPSEVLALGGVVAQKAPTTAMVVLRSSVKNGFLPAAMKAGVRDVIDLSSDEDAYGAVARAVAWAESVQAPKSVDNSGPRGKVITIFSSKGGSGKSFLSCNLAAVIAQEWGKETALVDVDVAMGDAFAYFGQQSTHHLRDVMAVAHKGNRDAILGVATGLGEHLYGFAAPPDPAAESISADDVQSLIDPIAAAFEYVVVDVPGGYADPVLNVLDASDLVILLASLDVVGVRHLAKAVETLTSIGVGSERMRVVLNRSDSVVGLTPKDVEQVLRLKVSWLIPSSRLVPASLNEGTPVVLAEPRSDVAKSVRRMAEQIIGHQAPESRSKRRLFAKA